LGQQLGRPDGRMYCGDIAELVEADVWWRISNAVDWQPQRLVRSSSPRTAAPYAEGIGRQSERAYTKPAPRRSTNASNASSASSLVSLSALTLLQFTSTFFL